MRKVMAVLAVVVFMSVASSAYAHPPSDIKITFDPKTKTVQAVIIHHVSNPAKHYIYKVDIGLNGKEIQEIKFTKQDNNVSQTVSYSIADAKDGDVVSVQGYCNLSGTLTRQLKLPAAK